MEEKKEDFNFAFRRKVVFARLNNEQDRLQFLSAALSDVKGLEEAEAKGLAGVLEDMATHVLDTRGLLEEYFEAKGENGSEAVNHG